MKQPPLSSLTRGVLAGALLVSGGPVLAGRSAPQDAAADRSVAGGTPLVFLADTFADGERVTQALPESAAWFTSSGSGNLVATVGELRQIVSSSRTFLAYFTNDQGAPVTVATDQTLTLGFTFRFTGFDSAAPPADPTFRVGLLRGIPNPAATSGTGFVATGPPNTNARVSGDFGSNNPTSNAFSLYTGYAAFTSANAVGTPTPVRFYARNGTPGPSLLGSTSPFTQVPVGTPAPSSPMAVDTVYRGTLTVENTAAGNVLTYEVRRLSDSVVVMSHTVTDAATSMTAFDTVAFYLSKAGASANYDFVLNEVEVTRTDPGPVTYPLTLTVDGDGTVAADPGPGPYAPGTVVTLTATAGAGSTFTGWTGDLAGSTNPATLTMDAPKGVTAHFTVIPTSATLTVSTVGQGRVRYRGHANPTFPFGTVVKLTAEPARWWTFAGWGGALSGNANPAFITMSEDREVIAAFAPTGPTPDFGLYGWAATNGGTTGGAGGPEVVVTTVADLRHYAYDLTEPYIIKVAGTISGNEVVRVRSNKSILGVGFDARLLGVGLQVGWNSEFGLISNVIVRNLSFEKALAPIDGVAVAYGAHNVWIDHCDFSSDREHGVDFYDGLLDVNHGADFITVSWSRFHDHYKTSLVGNSDSTGDEDAGHLTVTYHHNAFHRSGGRNPSVRFGTVHAYNNHYLDLDDYGVASRMEAQVLVENNWFENVNRPIRADTSLSPIAGFVRGQETNTYVNCTPNSITSPPATWVPPYVYPLDPVGYVPGLVNVWSGVGIVTF
jgi:pectate lyase